MRESEIEPWETGGKSELKQQSAMPSDSNRPGLETKKWSELRLNSARTHKLPQILSKRGSPGKANSSARRAASASSANRNIAFQEGSILLHDEQPVIHEALDSRHRAVEPGRGRANDGHRTPSGVQEMTGLRHSSSWVSTQQIRPAKTASTSNKQLASRSPEALRAQIAKSWRE